MSGGISQANTELQNLDRNATNAASSTDTLQNKVKSGGASFVQLGLGIAAAASGVVNLIRQYHNLQKAQRNVNSLTGSAENAMINLQRKQDAYNKAVEEYGENSDEARKARDDLTKAENNATRSQNRLKNAQIALNDRMMDFALSIGPSVVGIVAGLAQTFDILGNRVGGTRGLGMGFLKFGVVLAVVGAAVFAFKNNIFGLQDIVNRIGVAIGNAVPGLIPFLDALKNVAIVFGLMPGDAKKAQEALQKFGGGVIKWAQDVWGGIQDIFKKLTSGDVLGAVNTLKKSVSDALKPVVDFIKNIKIGDFSVEQWLVGIQKAFETDFVTGFRAILGLVAESIKAGWDQIVRPILLKMQIDVPTSEQFQKQFEQKGLAFAVLTAVNNALLSPGAQRQITISANVFGPISVSIVESITSAIVGAINSATAFTKGGSVTTAIQNVMTNAGKVVNWGEVIHAWFVAFGLAIAGPFMTNEAVVNAVNKLMIALMQSAIDIGFAGLNFTNAVSGLLNGIGGMFADMLNNGKQLFLDTGKAILQEVVNGIMKAPELLAGIGKWIMDNIIKKIPGIGGLIPTSDIPGPKDSLNAMDPEFLKMSFGGGETDPFGTQMAQMVVKAAQTKEKITQIFLEMSGQLSNIWLGMAQNFSAMMNSFGPNANSARSQVIQTFLNMSGEASNVFLGMATTWSAMMNSMGANAKSGASQVVSAMKSMANTLSSLFKKIASDFSSAMNKMKSAASSAASSIVASMKKIENAAKAAAAAQAKVGKAKGGIMSFATGGMMTAATGKVFTTKGAQNVLVGDNPGGRETVAFIPHNDPGPTLERLRSLFGGIQMGMSTSRGSASVSTGGSNGPCIINVYLDGKPIKGAVVQMLAANQSAMK
jgi:hypothetical protein